MPTRRRRVARIQRQAGASGGNLASPTENRAIPISGPSPYELFAKQLGSLNSSLDKFFTENREKAKREADAVAFRKLGGLTIEEQDELVRSGQIANVEGPFAQAAAEKLFGSRLAMDTIRGARSSLEDGTFDLNDGNIEDFLLERYAQGLGSQTNEHVLSGFASVFSAKADEIRETHRSLTIAAKTAKRDGVLVGSMVDLLDQTKDQSVDEQFASIQAFLGSARETMSLTGKDVNRISLAAATKFAEAGHEDLVNRILDTRRQDGTPALSEIPSLQGKTSKIRNAVERRAFEITAEAQQEVRETHKMAAAAGDLDEKSMKATGAFSQAEEESLVVQNANALRSEAQRHQTEMSDRWATSREREIINSMKALGRTKGAAALFMLRDFRETNPFDGDEETFDGRKLAEVALDEMMQEAATTLNPTVPGAVAEITAMQTAIISDFGIAYEPWERALKGGMASAINLVNSSDRGEVDSSGAEATYSLFRNLKSANPAVLQMHLDAQSDEYRFFDTAVWHQDVGGLDNRSALLAAARSWADPTRRLGVSPSQLGKIRDAAKDLEDTQPGLLNDDKGRNPAYAESVILHGAREYVALGQLNETQAVEKAQEAFLASHQVINGYWVPTRRVRNPLLRDKNRMEALIQESTQLFVQSNPEAGYEQENLTLMPAPTTTGLWFMVHGDTQYPVFDDNNQIVAFTERDLVTRAQVFEEAERQKAAEEVTQRQDRKQHDRITAKAGSRNIAPNPFSPGAPQKPRTTREDIIAEERRQREQGAFPEELAPAPAPPRVEDDASP